MTDLMKKAARAVVDTDLLSGGCHGDKMWAGEEIALAVLMAVRNLPDGFEHIVYPGPCDHTFAREAFADTIDAILAEEG